MTRLNYASIINWKGTATRMIAINEIPEFKIGDIINPGLCWTDGGEFRIESYGEYNILFRIEDEIEGHQVDYDNKQEVIDLGAEDCEDEKEILINKDFIISDFWEWNEETEIATVFLKTI